MKFRNRSLFWLYGGHAPIRVDSNESVTDRRLLLHTKVTQQPFRAFYRENDLKTATTSQAEGESHGKVGKVTQGGAKQRASLVVRGGAVRPICCAGRAACCSMMVRVCMCDGGACQMAPPPWVEW